MLRVAADESSHAELAAGLDEIVREGARRMLAAALEAEVEAYLAAHAHERDEAGRRLVVRTAREAAAGDDRCGRGRGCARHGWRTGGSTRRVGSGAAFAARSCRR